MTMLSASGSNIHTNFSQHKNEHERKVNEQTQKKKKIDGILNKHFKLLQRMQSITILWSFSFISVSLYTYSVTNATEKFNNKLINVIVYVYAIFI